MKKYLLLSFLSFAVCNIVSAQGLFELKVKQLSLEPDYKAEQIHTLVLKNTSSANLTFKISSENIKCQEQTIKKETDLIQEIMSNNNSSRKLNGEITLTRNEVYEFSIKIKKPTKATLGSVNCTKVTANTVGTRPANQFVIIKSFIPDPKAAN